MLFQYCYYNMFESKVSNELALRPFLYFLERLSSFHTELQIFLFKNNVAKLLICD